MREQGTIVQTGRMRRQLGKVVFVELLLAAAILFGVSLKLHYTHPSMDANAKNGEPMVDAPFLYENFETDFGYHFYLAANSYQQEDGSCYVYFTNPMDNEVNLMYEMVEAGTSTILYKSGVIEPGQYIEKLAPFTDFSNEKKDVTVKVYAFEQETWESEGTSTAELILQPW